MQPLHIIYAYCPCKNSQATLERCLSCQGVLKTKTLSIEHEHLVFALLIAHADVVAHPPEGVHIVGHQSQTQYTQEKTLPLPALSRLSPHSLLGSWCDVDRQAIKRARKVYRKQKNQCLAEQNWKQHVNRNRAIRMAVKAMDVQFKKSADPMLYRLASYSHPTRASVAPA